MKIFWAWQGDTPGRIGRFFVRDALEEAIEKLKQPKDIEEPPEEARRNDLHVDYDTKNLKGSPEVAAEIFKKIAAATVVVADVTPVGTGAARPGKNPKPLMNPNVSIELGYAFGKLGTDCFLPILNLAYGDAEGLPFDIAHRRFPTTFNLTDKTTNDEVKAEKKLLVDKLIIALKPYLETGQADKPAQADFPAATAKIPPAFYFDNGEVLFRAERENADFTMPFRSVIYMRVHPRKALEGNLDINMLRNNVSRYGVFGSPAGAYVVPNKYGVIVGMPAGNTPRLDTVLQYFRTGEIWGINADILRQGERGLNQYLFTKPFEDLLITSLGFALQFHAEVTKIPPPFYVEMGVVGVANRQIAHMGGTLSKATDPVLASDIIKMDGILNSVDEKAQQEFLLKFFEKVNKDSGVTRPAKLYNRW
jgi:hypothetical protein